MNTFNQGGSFDASYIQTIPEQTSRSPQELEAACKIQQILEEFGAKEVAHLLEKTLEEE